MLTKRKRNIITVVFSVIMLISVVIGFCTVERTVNAEDVETPSLAIKANNVSYDDSVYVLYAITSNGFDRDKCQIKMLFWTDLQDAYTYNTVKYVTTDRGSVKLGGEDCLIFYSQGLAAKKMTDDLYARAYVEVNGVAYYSDVMKFSVLEYVYTMRDRDKDSDESNNLKEEQRELFDKMLDYGGAAQNNFDYNTDRMANDTYYSVKVKDGRLPDGFDHGRYKKGDKHKLVADEPKPGKRFSHWKDKHGNIVSTDKEFEIEVGEEDESYEAVYKDINDIGTSVSLTSEIEYNGTAENIGLPETISFVYNEETVSLGVTWNKEYFKEKQIGTQTLVATLIDISAYNTYDIEPGGITMTVKTLPYALTLNSTTNNYSITGYYGGDTAITLPSEYKAKTVGEIGDYAFDDKDTLVTVTIPNTYTAIGQYAFRNCDILNAIKGGDAVQTIGNYAFHNCDGLVTVELGKCVTSIGYSSFYNCYNLESVVCNDNLKTIGDSAFYNCYKLANVTIGANVTSIGYSAFYYCSALTKIDLPDSLTNLGSSAFYNCTSLKSIVIPEKVKEICGNTFYNCTSLASATIGKNVSSIGGSAFYNCSSLEEIVIPDSVITLGSNVFSDCTNLKSATIGKNVTSIPRYGFFNCSALITINLPDSITSIGDSAFLDCSSLAVDIVIPESVTSIKSCAFKSCASLTNITLPNSITSIESETFSGCSSLISITIPDNITKFGVGSFYKCDGLKKVYYTGTIDQWCQIDFKGGSNPIYYADELYIDNKLVTEANITTATKINDYAFSGYSSLTNIIIGNTVESIGSCSFERCSSLSSIIIPDSVTSIGSSAFSRCDSLTSITIPGSVTSIGEDAFYENNALTRVDYTGTIDQWVQIDFINSTTLWCYTNPLYYAEELYINERLVTEINITAATKINANAFWNYDNLTSVTISGNVTSIGRCAFYGCSNLMEITLPNSLMNIGGYAFYMCKGLKKVYYTGTIDSWCQIDFKHEYSTPLQYAKNLYINNELVVEANITTATKISDYAFFGCSSLTSVTIPSSVTSIGKAAFTYCRSLTSVIISNSVTSIGAVAFSGCAGLTSVIIPNSVTSIGSSAFSDCNSLASIYYTGNKNEWESITNLEHSDLTEKTIYYYSELEPTLNEEGTAYNDNYWHYDTDGITPVIWGKDN